MEEGVAGPAALITQRRNPLVTHVVCGVQRIMMNARGGQGTGENLHAYGACCRQSIRAKTGNRVGIGGIAGEAVHIRGNGIDNPAVRQRLGATRRVWSALAQPWKHDQSGILGDVCRNCDLFDVVAEAIAAAEYEPVPELVVEQRFRSPGKTDLRSEVIFLSIPRVVLADDQARQVGRPRPGYGAEHVVLFRVQRGKVGPAKAEIERQIRANFKVILDEEAPEVFTLVLAN